MQAQQTRNEVQAISQTQSMAAIKTLLSTGLGAITYLRNLLPEDNFTSSYFTSLNTDDSFQSVASQDANPQRNINGFRVMTLTKGFTSEADRLIDYLENGIFDALEKQYLKSFIFAIYLDSNDPNNIIEAYTFNFKYYAIPGTNTAIPLMTLGDQLGKMSLNQEDPVAKAVKSGKAPTLGDVKRSVKALLKSLISVMQHMDPLPRRRFATFKVFYTDLTPVDYEPPHFQTGDAVKDRWYFMTHDLDEVPEHYKIGKIHTGHHSVNLDVRSISTYLPMTSEDDDAIFAGTVSQPRPLNLTPLQEAAASKHQMEQQLADAESRNCVWSADDLVDEDAEAEDDPEYVRQPDGSYLPVGMRGCDGTIGPLPAIKIAPIELPEAFPSKLQDIAAMLRQADQSGETQELPTTPKTHRVPPSDSVDWGMESSPLSSLATPVPVMQTEELGNFNMETGQMPDYPLSDARGGEMLDLETQPQVPMESIETFAAANGSAETIEHTTARFEHGPDLGLHCDCDIVKEDDSLICEEGCKKWFHVWCMGYHSFNDARMPKLAWKCLDCRLRADPAWDLIKLDIYPEMMSKFKDLTVFRRAIKIAEQLRSFTALEFNKEYGCDTILGRQMIKRLEDEGFTLRESTIVDDFGLTTVKSAKAGQGKPKSKAKPKKTLQKTRYSFHFSLQSQPQYLDYFTPNDRSIENRVMGFVETVAVKPCLKQVTIETQTQEETQMYVEAGSKRDAVQAQMDPSNGGSGLRKKVKISVAMAVDLAE